MVIIWQRKGNEMVRRIVGVALLVAILTRCSLPSPLSPPGWIQGVWKDGSGYTSITFTPDNVIMAIPTMSMDYKQFDIDSGGGIISDSSSDSIYSVTM